MQARSLIALVLVLGIAVAGCASILGGGTKQNISISSSPDQASLAVKTTGGVQVFAGKTPATVELQRKNEYVVEISLAGYKNQTVPIQKSMNAWLFGNIICGGIIGIVIDLTNGAAFNLEPGQIHVELLTASYRDGTEQLYAVITRLDDDGRLRSLPVPMIPVASASAR